MAEVVRQAGVATQVAVDEPGLRRHPPDFGNGALGDMGRYSFDTIFRVLKLEAPTSVQASSTDRFAETFPRASIIHFDFPARGDLPPVTLTWYE